MQYDVFISHSSHDKEEVARPLAQALQARGLHVWLDEEQLYVGDSIRRGIDNALRDSRFGVVILSPAYLESEWGQKELDAFFAKEKYQNKSILPIYHGVDVEDIERHWMTLADKISLSTTTESIDSLADKIQQSIQRSSDTSVSPVPVKKKLAFWPSNNWQWLIGVLAACVVGVLPFVIPSQPTSQNKIAGGTFYGPVTQIGTQINNSQLDEEALAKRLLSGMKNIQQESLQVKEEEIKRLKATIQNLKNQPFDELKQSALKKLEENKPAEASELLEQSLAKRSKVMSQDWVDVGNIAYLTDSRKALDAYQKAIAINPDNIIAWNRLGHIYDRLGRLDKSVEAYNNVLKLAGGDEFVQAVAYGNLGLIYEKRGELDKAEDYHLKALRINEALGHREGMASNYGNLGLIYRRRGELDKAEEYHLKSLEIEEALGRQEGMANQYGNLGLIYQTRGELDKAEKFLLKSLKINGALGRQEGMANQYGNLGLIYLTRGELDKAEKFLLKSLKINEALGRQEGMANQYGNLGLIYLTRGELDKAEKFLLKSLKINEALGRQEGMANQYGNLGLIYQTRGELDKAEKFLLNSLKINEALGRQEYMASDYGNLGVIYETRGELGQACQYWKKSVVIFKKVGSATERQVQSWIDESCSETE